MILILCINIIIDVSFIFLVINDVKLHNNIMVRKNFTINQNI